MPGYPAVAVSPDEVKEGMVCRHCHHLLRDPVQTEEGDRVCRSCFSEILKLPDCSCADCGITVVEGMCYPDRAINRQILKLLVRCRYSSVGCQWAGQLADWETHGAVCEYLGVPCPHPDCRELVPSRELDKHKQECSHRPTSCPHCSTRLTFSKLKRHLDEECSAVPVKCPNCDAELPRSKLASHSLEECDVLECAICSVKVLRDSALELPQTDPSNSPDPPVVHLSDAKDMFNHMQALATKHRTLAAEVAQLRSDTVELSKAGNYEEHVASLRQIAEGLGSKITQIENQFMERFADINKELQKLLRRDKNMADKLQTQEKEMTKLRREMEQTKTKCEQNSDEIKRLPSRQLAQQQQYSGGRLRPDSSSPDTHNPQLAEIHKKLEELTLENITIKHTLSDLELQLQASLASTHTGSFLWRIPEFPKRRREAIEEKITSIYSPPFYTGRNGYKMCIRAYLNGDGMGYRTHLSLFFVIMKGEYDPLLKWPFDYKVSMILVDQTHRKHIVQTFKPTPESNSFMKPVSDMNVASGCPTFTKLSVFDDPENDYVKDDVMFVKCIVDTTRIFHP